MSTHPQPQPQTHILHRANYSHHHLISLPTPSPSQPLAPSTLRLRPKLLGLTTNNLTYARFGHLMGWYDIYPLPPSTPAPYNDDNTYARIAAWGYGEIVGSTVPGIDAGESVYGFLPIGNGVEDICVERAIGVDGVEIPGQVIVTNGYRQHVWKIYNRYQICAPIPQLLSQKGAQSLGWDALMQGLFATGYNLARFGFAWDAQNLVHPSGEGKGEWDMADADLKDAGVVVLNASGKTGMGFAFSVQRERADAHKPRLVVGVGSEKSVGVIGKSGLYDVVVLNEGVEEAVRKIGAANLKRIVLLDFGAREGVAQAWAEEISNSLSDVPLTKIIVGGEVKIQDPEAAKRRLEVLNTSTVVHAGLLKEKGIEVGGADYLEEFYEAFERFKKTDVGIELSWGEGLEGWRDGWEGLCKDEIRANVGLVYRI